MNYVYIVFLYFHSFAVTAYTLHKRRTFTNFHSVNNRILPWAWMFLFSCWMRTVSLSGMHENYLSFSSKHWFVCFLICFALFSSSLFFISVASGFNHSYDSNLNIRSWVNTFNSHIIYYCAKFKSGVFRIFRINAQFCIFFGSFTFLL